jgi:hypothetical protein
MPSVDHTNTVTNGKVISKQCAGNENKCGRHSPIRDPVPAALIKITNTSVSKAGLWAETQNFPDTKLVC